MLPAVVLFLMANKIPRAKIDSKVRSKLVAKERRYQDKEAPLSCLQELACKVFLKLNHNFKKDIRRIRTRALSKCL